MLPFFSIGSFSPDPSSKTLWVRFYVLSVCLKFVLSQERTLQSCCNKSKTPKCPFVAIKYFHLLFMSKQIIMNFRRSDNDFSGKSYECPLWINEQKLPALCSDDDVIMHVPIATETPSEDWLMKGVSITGYLGDD